MRVMVIGSGGREHALCWKLKQSPLVSELYCLPGNAGTVEIAQTGPARSIPELAEFAQKQRIDLTVVGPEAPLADGIVDYFRSRGLVIFGPTRAAARIESSKSFAKQIMEAQNVPTAKSRLFRDPQAAKDYILGLESVPVIKADGLATGKGVVVPASFEEAVRAIDEIMVEKIHGSAGDIVVIEERLVGREASVFALTDGENIRLFPAAQDHKRAYDGDQGPNTGGMGAFAPTPVVSSEMLAEIEKTIIRPTLRGLAEAGAPYSGLLYAGLMLTADGPKVIEFNCRFGDPETQVVLPLVRSDLAQLLWEAAVGELVSPLEINDLAAVSVVVASGGYPGPYQKGIPINGLAEAKNCGVEIFHAGTGLRDGQVVTAGGRILNVMAVAESIGQARERVYQALEKIKIKDAFYRQDIASMLF
ncbi:MAG: phosphoribosylamine--glycine ligase [Firmicutes bacterium]|nr:phosphoribosylamine--glycine ligase [Bacillota bacterium]